MITLALAILAAWLLHAPARAAAADDCAASARACCGQIVAACVKLKYCPPHCLPPHRALETCAATPCVCLERVCHKPLTTCYPDAPCLWLEPVCHKTVTPVDPAPADCEKCKPQPCNCPPEADGAEAE